MLAARCFCNLENFDGVAPKDRYDQVFAEVSRATQQLHGLENELLLRLIASDPMDRISEFIVLEPAIHEIIAALDLGLGESQNKRPLLLAIKPELADLLEEC